MGADCSLVLFPLLSKKPCEDKQETEGRGAVSYLFSTGIDCMSKAAGCRMLSELKTAN